MKNYKYILAPAMFFVNLAIAQNQTESIPIGLQKPMIVGVNFVNIYKDVNDQSNASVQSMLRVSFPLLNKNRFEKNLEKKCIPAVGRNLMFDLRYANAPELSVFYDSMTNCKYLNNLDLFQYSKVSAALYLNVVSLIFPDSKTTNTDKIYFDLFANLTRTEAFDSTKKDHFIASANCYGANVKLRKYLKLDNRQLNIELGGQCFVIYNTTNKTSYDLNPQSKDLNSIYENQNARRPIQAPKNTPIFGVGVLAEYQLSEGSDNANLYIRYDYFSNYKRQPSAFYNNSFYQFQLGVSVNFLGLLNYNDKTSKNNKSDSTK